MKLCVCLCALGVILHEASSRIHTMRIFSTASSQVPNFPEYVHLIMVDGVQVTYYDSNTKEVVPKQDWMNKVTEEYPNYWKDEFEKTRGHQAVFKNNIEVAKKRLNQTGDVHIFQWMHGCDWDDETGEVKGYDQLGFDGEDFIVYDYDTETWVAPRQEAFPTKLKWDRDEARKAYWKYYYTQQCPEYLKKYVGYGESTLMRTVMPKISLLQKSPSTSSPVTCHATGFYPDGAMLFWTKDGEDFYEGVELWEVLPNHDGTFQKSAELDVSSIPDADWGRYNCVFQLSGVKEDVFTKLDKDVIKSNEKPQNALIITAAVVAVFAAVVAVIGCVLYRRKKEKLPNPLIITAAVVAVFAAVVAVVGCVLYRRKKEMLQNALIITAAVVAVFAPAVAVIGCALYRRKKAEQPATPERKPPEEEELRPMS